MKKNNPFPVSLKDINNKFPTKTNITLKVLNEYELRHWKYSRGIKFSKIGKCAAFDKFAASSDNIGRYRFCITIFDIWG